MGGGDFVHVYKNEQGGFCPGGDYVRIPKRNDRLLAKSLRFIFESENELKFITLRPGYILFGKHYKSNQLAI